MSTVSRIPQICQHKATNQAVVRLNGHDYYLGRFGSAAAKSGYERLIAEWLANGRQLPNATANFSVNNLILAYWRRCEQHYRMPDGQPSSELGLVRLAMRPLKLLYGKSAAVEFGPMALKAVRSHLVANRLFRGVVNAHVGRIKRMFRWAVENELVPPSIYHGLQAVAGLQHGRSEARETQPVRPAPDQLIDAALVRSPRPVAAMAKLQGLTGMRPGEACIIRACDLDTRGHVWVYTPGFTRLQATRPHITGTIVKSIWALRPK
jgi:integrase